MNSPTILAVAPFDSKRFGIKVMRALIESKGLTDQAAFEIGRADADLVIFRVPAGETRIAMELARQGHIIIHADTLVYYGIDLQEFEPEQNPVTARQARPADRAAIASIAANSFRGYRSHYTANPLLPPTLVHSGYVEWALSRLTGSQSRNSTWVVESEGTVAGFATCDVEADQVEIILNAVDPDFERKGLYGGLLRRIIQYHAELSMKRLIISTQLWNYTVQRQWAKAGLRLFKAYDTYHLDRRLTAAGSRQ